MHEEYKKRVFPPNISFTTTQRISAGKFKYNTYHVQGSKVIKLLTKKKEKTYREINDYKDKASMFLNNFVTEEETWFSKIQNIQIGVFSSFFFINRPIFIQKAGT